MRRHLAFVPQRPHLQAASVADNIRLGRPEATLADVRRAARLSLAFLAGAAMDADLPVTRPRAQVEGCRDLTAADMVRNGRTGTVRVDPRSHAVTLDGEAVAAPPVERVAFSDRFLLG